jgi:hypothetical protein
VIVVALLVLGLVSDVSSRQNPSQLLGNDIRRRSGSPGRPASWGPPRKRDGGIPLVVSNQCSESIWPAIETQGGTGAGTGGFLLEPGTSRNLTVGGDWTGRVWGRTNCSFNANGTGPSSGSGAACTTGDCNGLLSCVGPVRLSLTTQDYILMLYREMHQRRLQSGIWKEEMEICKLSTIYRSLTAITSPLGSSTFPAPTSAYKTSHRTSRTPPALPQPDC